MTSLEEKIKELASKVEESHKDGRIPADYSLGFLNGLVLANHLLGGGKGEPRYYDRTTSIGVLPKPMALRSGSALKDEQTFQQLLDELILEVRKAQPRIRMACGDLSRALDRIDEFSNNRIGDMVDALNRQNPSPSPLALSLVPRLAGRGSGQSDGPDGEDSQNSNPLA